MNNKIFNLSEELTKLFNELPISAEVGYRTELRDKIDLILKDFIESIKDEIIYWRSKGKGMACCGNLCYKGLCEIIDNCAGDRLKVKYTF